MTSPTGTTAPPSTEILFDLADGEADPLPVGREERPVGSLRARKLGGFRLIEAAGEQPCWRARDEDQPHAIGRDRDAAPERSREEGHVRAQIDIQPHQRPIGRFLRTPRRPQRTQREATAATASSGARPGQDARRAGAAAARRRGRCASDAPVEASWRAHARVPESLRRCFGSGPGNRERAPSRGGCRRQRAQSGSRCQHVHERSATSSPSNARWPVSIS